MGPGVESFILHKQIWVACVCKLSCSHHNKSSEDGILLLLLPLLLAQLLLLLDMPDSPYHRSSHMTAILNWQCHREQNRCKRKQRKQSREQRAEAVGKREREREQRSLNLGVRRMRQPFLKSSNTRSFPCSPVDFMKNTRCHQIHIHWSQVSLEILWYIVCCVCVFVCLL